VNLLAAVLVTGLALAPSPVPPGGLSQSLDPAQAVVAEPVVLGSGHVDIGPRYRDGRWTIQIHDDARVPPVWRNPDDAVLRVRDTARRPVPDDDAYAFLGERPGTEVHVVPQTQQQDLVWIGWNTQDPGVLRSISRGVTMTLRGVQGPGRLSVYLQSGSLGAPEVLWSSAKSGAQPLWVETNTHTHANWVFGRPGSYLVAVDISADLADGSTVTAGSVLRFAVGDQTDPDAVRAERFTAPLAAVASTAPVARQPAAETRSTAPFLAVGAVVLLVALLLTVTVRAAAVRRRAERERRP
jgi:surface-anchored protein